MTRPLQAAAVALAERRYSVFPLKPGSKAPSTPHGFKNATRDHDVIAGWWGRWPNANIGLACGASGVVVFDIDTKAGADPREILAELDRGGAPVVATGLAPQRSARYPRSLPGRRGIQVYFRGEMRSASRLTIAGCEIKGAGGYVVAPPSVHPCGVEYVGQLPPAAELPPVPSWLIELVRAPRTAQASSTRLIGDPGRILEGLARTVRQAEVGQRNHLLYWGSCRVVEHAGEGELDEYQALEELRLAAIDAGLTDSEARATISSAQRTGRKQAA